MDFGQVHTLSGNAKKAFREMCESASTKLGQARSQLTKDVKADLDSYKNRFEAGELALVDRRRIYELPPAGYLPVTFDSLDEAEVAARGNSTGSTCERGSAVPTTWPTPSSRFSIWIDFC